MHAGKPYASSISVLPMLRPPNRVLDGQNKITRKTADKDDRTPCATAERVMSLLNEGVVHAASITTNFMDDHIVLKSSRLQIVLQTTLNAGNPAKPYVASIACVRCNRV